MKSLRVKIAVVFLLGFSLTASPALVQAASTYSGWGVYTAGATTYANRSGITTDSGHHRAIIDTRKSNSTAAAPGWLGGNARLFYGSALCKQSGFAYNTVNATLFSRYTAAPGCATGPAYGGGASSVYNGNGYTTFGAFTSPVLYI